MKPQDTKTNHETPATGGSSSSEGPLQSPQVTASQPEGALQSAQQTVHSHSPSHPHSHPHDHSHADHSHSHSHVHHHHHDHHHGTGHSHAHVALAKKKTAALQNLGDSLIEGFRKLKGRQLILLILGIWLLSGVYIVPADEQAVVTRFGRVVEPRVSPGIHMTFPWPIDKVYKVKVNQLQRLVIGGEITDTILGRVEPISSQFLTGDQNIIHMRVVVQYSVSSPVDYLFRSADVRRIVGAIVEAELVHRLASRTVDEVLTTGRPQLQEDVRVAAQKILDQRGIGVLLSTVNIEQVSPPPEAADAFRDVASARADAERMINEAQAYANDILPKARGEAQKLLTEAEAYRQRRINQASGDAERFKQLVAEVQRAESLNEHRLYVETLEQVLPRIKKLFVDANGNLDLTMIRRDPTSNGSKPSGQSNITSSSSGKQRQ